MQLMRTAFHFCTCANGLSRRIRANAELPLKGEQLSLIRLKMSVMNCGSLTLCLVHFKENEHCVLFLQEMHLSR